MKIVKIVNKAFMLVHFLDKKLGTGNTYYNIIVKITINKYYILQKVFFFFFGNSYEVTKVVNFVISNECSVLLWSVLAGF